MTNTEHPAPETTMADVIAALESVWAEIQGNHSEVPDAVIIVGSGTAGRRASQGEKFGHHAQERWLRGEDKTPEVFIGGEGLRRGAVAVTGTLIHEAAHALAHARGVQDTSRQGRYHNAKFKKLAEELGISVTQDKAIGWSPTTVPNDTEAAYATVIRELETVIQGFHRGVEPSKVTVAKEKVFPECTVCQAQLKISKKALEDLGTIVHEECEAPFRMPETD